MDAGLSGRGGRQSLGRLHRPRGRCCLFSGLGSYSLVHAEGAGTWWQDGAGAGRAVSVGDRGLQLLQAAAAQLGSVRLSVLGQLLGAHRLWGCRLFRLRGCWGGSWR